MPPPAQAVPSGQAPLLASPALAAVQGYVESRPITLQDAIAIALYTNRPLATAAAALQRAQGRTGEARSLLLPTLGVNANLTEFDRATTANLGAFAPPGTPAPNLVITPQFNPTVAATLALPVDITGALRSARSQAQFNEVAARIDVNRVRNQLLFDVKTAFYNALRAQAQVAVATSNLNASLSRLSDATKNYAAGMSPRFDVLSAQRDVADAQQGLVNARAQVSLALASVKSTIGLDLSTPVRLAAAGAVEYPPGVAPPAVPPVAGAGGPAGATGAAGKTGAGTGPSAGPQGAAADCPPGAAAAAGPTGATVPDAAPPAIFNFTPLPLPSSDVVEDTFGFGPDYQALLCEALGARPEVLEAEAQITAAQRGIQYARRSSLPSVSLSLSYVVTPNATGFTRPTQAAAALGIGVPLFDAGLARSRVQEARADVATAQVARRQAADLVELDVRQAYVSLVQARDRVAVANVQLAQAREAYRIALVRYTVGVSAQGVSPQLELSNAQAALTLAQSNQVNALYDYNNARAQVDRAAGRYSWSVPGYPAPPGPAITGQKR